MIDGICSNLFFSQQALETDRSSFCLCAGPDHITIFISPLLGIHIISWSFGHKEPVIINTLPSLDDEGRDTHFVYYAYGQKPSKPWSFHIDFYVRCCLNLCFGFFSLPKKTGSFPIKSQLLSGRWPGSFFHSLSVTESLCVCVLFLYSALCPSSGF